MKRLYKKPTATLFLIELSDVIVASPGNPIDPENPGVGGGENDGPLDEWE